MKIPKIINLIKDCFYGVLLGLVYVAGIFCLVHSILCHNAENHPCNIKFDDSAKEYAWYTETTEIDISKFILVSHNFGVRCVSFDIIAPIFDKLYADETFEINVYNAEFSGGTQSLMEIVKLNFA
tara:strand:- start:278 stop:652 length:375 start_codon:yes stop_codon:yes gene_type:complete